MAEGLYLRGLFLRNFSEWCISEVYDQKGGLHRAITVGYERFVNNEGFLPSKVLSRLLTEEGLMAEIPWFIRGFEKF